MRTPLSVRAARTAFVGAASLALSGLLVLPGAAAAAEPPALTQLTVDAFTGTATGSAWVVQAVPGGQNQACLTASATTTQRPIPGCGASGQDADGSGALRLTTNAGNAVGSVFSTVSLPTSQGLDVRFDTYQFNALSPDPADGIAFALAATDPANPAPPSVTGPLGGSLGYSATPSLAGLPYGYLGFGLDAWGNFSNTQFSGGDCAAGSGLIAGKAYPEALVVHGPGNGLSGYCVIDSSATDNGAHSTGGGNSGGTVSNLPSAQVVDASKATTRPVPVPVEIAINPAATASTTASGLTVPARGWLFAATPLTSSGAAGTQVVRTGTLPAAPAGFPAGWINPTTQLPYQLTYGWSASTGGANEIHQINQLHSTTLNGPLAVLQTSVSNAENDQLVKGTAAHYTVTTSLQAGQGDESEAPTTTVTFPAGITPGTAPGCTTSGQTVTCAYSGGLPIAAGSNVGTYSIPATVTATGTYRVTAKASSIDANPATATDTATATAFTVTAAPASVAHGASVTVTTHGLPSTGTGTVAVTNGSGQLVCTITLPGTQCTGPDGDAPGSSTLSATWTPGVGYSASTTTTAVSVTKANPALTLTASPNPVGYGAGTTLTAAGLPADATGTLTFNQGSDAVCVDVPVAAPTCVLPSEPAGSYAVTVSYPGDANYAAASANATYTVVPRATALVITTSPDPSSYGTAVTATAAGLPADATGSVQVSDGSSTLCTISLPSTSCVLPQQAVGEHTVSGSYSGDGNNLVSTATTTLTVVKAAVTITATASQPAKHGEQVTLAASGLPTGASGTIEFTAPDGSTLCTATLPDTSCTAPADLPGSIVATAHYSGDDSYLAAQDTVTYAVDKATITATVTADPAPVVHGHSVTFTVVGLPADATGTVTMTDPLGSTLCTVTLPGTGCTTTATKPAGSYLITAAYPGDANYLAAAPTTTLSVRKAATTVTATVSPATPAHGTTVTVRAGALPADATGTLTMSDATGTRCTATLPQTSCSLPAGAVGPASITVGYAGDASYLASTDDAGYTVVKAPVVVHPTNRAKAKAGEPVTVTVHGVPTDAFGTVLVRAGASSCTITLPTSAPSCALRGLRSGLVRYTASYGGDAAHSPATETGTVTVAAVPTSTTSDSVAGGEARSISVTHTRGARVVIVGQPAHGHATVGADGTIHFTLDAGYSGPDSIRYTVTDPSGAIHAGTLALTATAPRPATASLAATGSRTGTLIGLAAALLVTGAACTVVGRRRVTR